MYEIMSDLGKYLVNRYALCLKGSNMPRPPLSIKFYWTHLLDSRYSFRIFLILLLSLEIEI